MQYNVKSESNMWSSSQDPQCKAGVLRKTPRSSLFFMGQGDYIFCFEYTTKSNNNNEPLP